MAEIVTCFDRTDGVVKKIMYYTDGVLHREGDQPAVEYFRRKQFGREFWVRGRLHRDGDLPAVDMQPKGPRVNDRLQEWYQDGLLHRDDDKPARVTWWTQEWYRHGKRHRDEGKPAIVHKFGLQEFFEHGQRVGGSPRGLYDSDRSSNYCSYYSDDET